MKHHFVQDSIYSTCTMYIICIHVHVQVLPYQTWSYLMELLHTCTCAHVPTKQTEQYSTPKAVTYPKKYELHVHVHVVRTVCSYAYNYMYTCHSVTIATGLGSFQQSNDYCSYSIYRDTTSVCIWQQWSSLGQSQDNYMYSTYNMYMGTRSYIHTFPWLLSTYM